MNKQKETYVAQSQAKSHEKKLTTIENQVKALNQEMTTYRMKSTFLIGLFLIIMMSALGSEFQGNVQFFFFNLVGVVVARLPFQPIFLIQGLTHRGILTKKDNSKTIRFNWRR